MFDFKEEHKMIAQMVRRWAKEKLEPKVDDLENGEPPYELMRDFAKTFGLEGMVQGAFAKMEKKAGEGKASRPRGGGLMGSGDAAMSAVLSIELSRVCPGFMLAFAASLGLAGGAIVGKGTMEQRKRWGLPILTLQKVGAWAMTEAGAGSDAFRAMRTVAVPRSGGGYVLNGSKTFITNAPYADISVIYAKIDHGDGTPLADRPIQAFVVEKEDAGIEFSKPMRKMGMHTSPTGEIFLEDCELPADRLLGLKEKKSVGRASGRDVFHAERTGVAPMAVGIIERCLEDSLAYSQERVTWGKKICEYQLIQEKLANMFVHLQNCRNLMFKEIALGEQGKSMDAAEASATKVYSARAATECALDAVQIMGGNGYMQEYRVEMMVRDAKLLQIGGGADEIQIINIARNLLTK